MELFTDIKTYIFAITQDIKNNLFNTDIRTVCVERLYQKQSFMITRQVTRATHHI